MAAAFGQFIQEEHAVVRQRHVARHRHVAAAAPPHMRNGVMGGASRASRHQRGAGTGEAGEAMDGDGVEGFREGHRRHDRREPPRQHRLARPGWSYGQPACNRHDFTMVTAGAFGDLQWLEAQRGTASQGLPPDRTVMSQYPPGPRGLTCPPSGGWPAGVELEPPGVVQADTHTTTTTNTIRMTCFHHGGTMFQRCHMLVSSGVPDGLAGCWLPSACEVAAPARVISQGSPGDHVRA
jgi:hypothetical protein